MSQRPSAFSTCARKDGEPDDRTGPTASNSAVYEDAFFPEKWVWELPNHFYGGPISAIGGTWFAAGVAAVYAGIAQAARDYLVAAGINGSRLEIISYGKERPFATGHDDSAWQQNRRAHLVVRSGS